VKPRVRVADARLPRLGRPGLCHVLDQPVEVLADERLLALGELAVDVRDREQQVDDRDDVRSLFVAGWLHGPRAYTLPSLPVSHAAVASKLAKQLGRETLPFKVDVRKLKKLGLTQSFEVGYEISPRGRAYLAAADKLPVTRKPRGVARRR
jgi:hypothetical protein